MPARQSYEGSLGLVRRRANIAKVYVGDELIGNDLVPFAASGQHVKIECVVPIHAEQAVDAAGS